MSQIAYALRERLAGTVRRGDDEVPRFTGGVIRIGPDADLNLREELDENDGVIVVSATDYPAVAALDEHPALKRVEVPEGAAITAGYPDRNRDDLRTEARRRGLIPGNATRDELAAGLEKHDTLVAAGAVIPAETKIADLESLAPDNPSGE
jgi:hypothetical protein